MRIADKEVFELVYKVVQKYHLPRLADARIAVAFNDSKPFINGRFNFGKTSKFSLSNKLWQEMKYDFEISVPEESWMNMLDAHQREALIDLRLNCCQVEYEPEMDEVNGKKKPAKDKYGRVIYTDVIKVDKDGNIKWKLIKEIYAIQDNVLRYGCWTDEFKDIKVAIKESDLKASLSKQE